MELTNDWGYPGWRVLTQSHPPLPLDDEVEVCIGALIHPSLITQLCRNPKLPMLEFKEKAHHQLPLSLPKAKDGAPENVEDEDKEDAVEQNDEDSEDEDSEADLP